MLTGWPSLLPFLFFSVWQWSDRAPGRTTPRRKGTNPEGLRSWPTRWRFAGFSIKRNFLFLYFSSSACNACLCIYHLFFPFQPRVSYFLSFRLGMPSCFFPSGYALLVLCSMRHERNILRLTFYPLIGTSLGETRDLFTVTLRLLCVRWRYNFDGHAEWNF